MKSRVHKPNAGRLGAFARRPPPLAGTGGKGPDREWSVLDGQGCIGLQADGVAPDSPEGRAHPSLDTLRRIVARMEGRMEAAARLEAPVAAGIAPTSPAAFSPASAPPLSPASEVPSPSSEVPSSPPSPPPSFPSNFPSTSPVGRSVGGAGAGSDARLPLGVPAFDGLFPAGGPDLSALTEIRVGETRSAGALTGFLAALLVALGGRRRGPILWAREERAVREAGAAAGLGLVHLGLDPARLLVVTVRDAGGMLWAMEEGLGCPGLAAVVGEMQGLPRAFDLTASRRLALRARESGVPALIAGHAMPEAASAAALRLSIAARLSHPAGGFDGGAGFPAWTVTVEKNRGGRTGRADMEWNSDDRRFRPLAPLPVALAADDADGPAGPPAPGQVMAYPSRRAS
jgi:protein ImuA